VLSTLRHVEGDLEHLVAQELALADLQHHDQQGFAARRQGNVVPVLLRELHHPLLEGRAFYALREALVCLNRG
jgi:hypothetical protein